MNKVRNRSVVQQVQDTDPSESFADNMGQNGVCRVQVHWRETTKDVVQLGEGVDDDENVACLEVRRIPEDHPARDAEISYGVERAEVDHCAHCAILKCGLVTRPPQAPQPGKLKQLLREEEGRDEERLGGPEGEVGVMDVLHVRRAKQSILLSSKVDDKGNWCDVACGG